MLPSSSSRGRTHRPHQRRAWTFSHELTRAQDAAAPLQQCMPQLPPRAGHGCTTDSHSGCGRLRRPDFQVAVAERAAKQAQHMQRVHNKRHELLDQELERRRVGSARSARRSAAVARAKAQAALTASMHERAKPWMILVEMCWRLAEIQVWHHCGSGAQMQTL